LNDFSSGTNRKITTLEETISVRHGFTKRTAYITTENSGTILLWYNHPGDFNDFSMYSGAAITSDFNKTCNIQVAKKTIWSKLSLSGSKKTLHSDNYFTHSNFVIKGEGFNSIAHLFGNSVFLHQCDEALDYDQRIRIYFNVLNFDFCPYLKDKVTIAIIIRDYWALEKHKIEKIFSLTEKLNKVVQEQFSG
jgi:hypothetical protein